MMHETYETHTMFTMPTELGEMFRFTLLEARNRTGGVVVTIPTE